jgi:alpha-tubulin suppressor-like RCC1 family protein
MTTPPAHFGRWSASRRTAIILATMALAAACTETDPSRISGLEPAAVRRVVASTPSVRLFMRFGGICSLNAAGTALCWGRNDDGQIGDGSTTDRTVKTPIGGGLAFADLALNDRGTCGLTTAGAAYCWGDDKERTPWQVDYRLLPRVVPGNDVFTVLTSSDQEGCGVTTLGETKCWQLLWTDVLAPQTVPGAPLFLSLTGGSGHECGLVATQLAYCQGSNNFGQVGNGSSGYVNVPLTAIGNGRRFISLSAGYYHTCAVDLGGTVYCWGSNFFGQVGNGTTSQIVDVPTRVATTLRFTKVVGGNSHTCGLTTAGAAWCWGNGYQGELGNGAIGQQSTPVAVQGGIVFRDIAAGGGNTCGVTYHGQVYCWGDNSYGQLLNGTKNDASTPMLLPM